MKQLFISLLFACMPAVAPAQDEGMTDRHSVATNTFWSNWFVSGGVGWGAWYGGVEDGRGWSKSPLRGFRSGPDLSLALGKWFTPGLGLRTRLSGVWGKAVWSDASAGNGNKYWMLNEQVMFNLTDMLCGYDPGRLWHFIPFIGAGVARSCTYNRYSAGLGAGILNEFRVSRRLAVSFEVGWNRFENDLAGMPAAASRGFMDHQNQFYAEAGITFRLGRKTWEAAADVSAISEMTQTELDALNAMLADPKVRIQYAGKYASSTNSYKSSKGMNIMIDLQSTAYLKERQMNELLNWGWDNDIAEYREAVDIIAHEVQKRAGLKKRMQYLLEALWIGTECSRVPTNFDALKEGLNGNDSTRRAALEAFDKLYYTFYDKDYAPDVDRRIAKAMLKMYADSIAPEYYPTFFKTINRKHKGDIGKYVDNLFENSLFVNPDKYEKWKKRPNLKLLENDGMVKYARAIKEEARRINEELQPIDKEIANAQKSYIAGQLLLHADKANYPDANFTLRLTYGQVKSYSPANAITYNFATTLDGVMEKEDPTNWEFVVDKKLKELYRKKDFGFYANEQGRMPVNFIANTHTTGGNSGSPVLNSRGELVGINFDRNWEGITGDIQYQSRYQRSIITDIRYILFIIDKYANADYLLDELIINP